MVEKLTQEQAIAAIAREVERQDAAYGPFDSSRQSTRLAIAALEDEVNEARDAWRKWKRRPDWYGLRLEAVQVAAVAVRLVRDVEVELTD